MFLSKRGIRISSKRKADTALNLNTLPIIEAVKLAKEPSSNKSHSYAIKRSIGLLCLELDLHGKLSHGSDHKLLINQSIQLSMLLLKTHQLQLQQLLLDLHLVV
jgi:hypothetical protein